MQALILLLIPLGVFLTCFYEKSPGKVHFAGALVTLFGRSSVKNVFQVDLIGP